MNTGKAIELLMKLEDASHTITNFIDGEWVPTEDHIESEDPSRGSAWIRIPRSTQLHVDLAVNAAHTAFHSWSQTSAEYRCRLLNKVADIIESNLDAFAIIESRDQGKPIALAKSVDIPRCIHNFRFFATAALHHLTSCRSQTEPVTALNYVQRDPVGVAALISPWNLPLYLLSFKLAPALATGNTVVAKPSELTSVTAWLLCHAFIDAGFPKGVVNVVMGYGNEAGDALVRHPQTPIVSFTGSTTVGRGIGGVGGSMLKKVSLEMGGKNACIVFPSCAPFTSAIPTIVRSCFANQGEICLCTSRLFVHTSVFDTFLSAFLDETRKLRVGDPREEVDLGALVSKAHFDKVTSFIDLARTEGKILLGDTINNEQSHQKGYFVHPTVVTGVSDHSRLMQEEIFGPVVCISPFDQQQEVVARANSVPYGLSASVWSNDVNQVHQVASQLTVGTVWCNCWLIRELNMPFGGTKASGTGREGAHDSIDFFTEQKTVCIRIQ